MQRKNWIYKNAAINKSSLDTLSTKLSPVIATLLSNRGISTLDEAGTYFSKPLSEIHPPKLLDDVELAAERIEKAVKSGEKIVVYGDYDVDGITSTVLLYKFLLSLNANVSYYIPSRADEGYGINVLALNKIAKSGTRLLITVDCGITAVGEVEFAKLQGIDVIVTDHHNCQEKLPKAFAVINPKRPDSTYPFRELAGVGVAFKLALGVAIRFGLDTSAVFSEYSELAAIGSIADLVPLVDENRVIVDRGLKKLFSSSSYPGIEALLKVSGADKYALDASTIAFTVAPRLNAAGRLSSAVDSVELLLSKNQADAESFAKLLDDENTKRRQTEQEIFDEALELINNDPNFDKKKVIVLHKRNWHQGVIGIVASRICELYFRPVILISVSEDGKGKGSGRSIPAFNLFSALENSADFLTSFGGHSVAAGLNISENSIEAFSKHINEYAAASLSEEDLIPSIKLDCEIPASVINLKNIKFLSRLEPFGFGNDKPTFSMCGVMLDSFSCIGSDKKHLRLSVSKGGLTFNCIGFGMGKYASALKQGEILDIAFCMSINNYQGRDLIQLRLKDIRTSDHAH